MILLSILIYLVFNIFYFTNLKEKNISQKTISKLEFENTRFFLEKNGVDSLSYGDEVLYFDNSVLLKDVKRFNLMENSNYYDINICIKNDKNCIDFVLLK